MSAAGAGAWARRGKRPADVLLSLAALIVALPLLVLAAVLVALTSRGGVLFSQVRIGRGGRSFRALKLRTMRVDHAHDPTEIVALTHPRVTAVGRVLRRTKLDELPQLFNVLRGDMSLVGPRPALPEQVAQYDAFQLRRLEVRPGLTGLAQVNGNAALSWAERIRHDVRYIDRLSLALDLSIVCKTLLVIVLGERRFVRRPDVRGPADAPLGAAPSRKGNPS